VYRVPELAGPEIKSTNYEVNAYITADETTQGVIYAVGEHIGGQACLSRTVSCGTAIPPSACTGTISTAM
jgi:hypothetical protein